MVEQVDREAAESIVLHYIGTGPTEAAKIVEEYRLAAAKAERERIADWLDGGGGRAKALAVSIRAGEYKR